MAPSMYIDMTLTYALCQPNLISAGHNVSNRNQETKKEKIARIAKEKMYASWKVINQKQVNLNELVRISKPKYNLLARNRC